MQLATHQEHNFDTTFLFNKHPNWYNLLSSVIRISTKNVAVTTYIRRIHRKEGQRKYTPCHTLTLPASMVHKRVHFETGVNQLHPIVNKSRLPSPSNGLTSGHLFVKVPGFHHLAEKTSIYRQRPHKNPQGQGAKSILSHLQRSLPTQSLPLGGSPTLTRNHS